MVRSLTALASLALIIGLAAVQFQNRVGITVVSYSAVRPLSPSVQNASAVGPVSESAHDQTSMLSRLEFQAHKIFEEKRNVPLQELPTSNSNAKKVHYRIWPHSLSPGFPAHSSFKLQNKHNSEEKWTPMSCTRRITCKADHKMGVHFPHFAQAAFPCWSALQRCAHMPNVETFMEVPRYALTDNSSWHYQLLQGVQEAGIAVIAQGERHASALPKLKASDITTSATSNIKPESCEWMVTHQSASPWPLCNYKDSQSFPVPSCQCFEKQEHMELLQQTILKSDFAPTSNRSNNELNVLILNREGSTRHWVHAEETRDFLNQEWNAIGSVNQTEQLLNITIRPSFSGLTFFQQALETHRADIVISPHGAQLTNLAFIQPCTAVVELFPQHHFLGFFQSYVIAGKGISMNGCPMDREPIEDTRRVTTDSGVRGSARSGPMLASPESLAQAIPGIVLEVLSCRRRQSMFSGMTESRHQVEPENA